MKHPHKNRQAVWQSLCANLREGDGQPIEHKPTRNQDTDRKTRQLCAQALKAAHLALASAHDPCLQQLLATDCQLEPGKGCRALILTVGPNPHTSDSSPDSLPNDWPERLQRFAPHIRHAIVQTIHRKKAPTLTILPTPAPGSGQRHASRPEGGGDA